MDKYTKGTVKFDNLLVMGRDFVDPAYKADTGFYDYAFSVEAYTDWADPPKKGKPKAEVVHYAWTGHINICVGSARIHLHSPDHDYGLVKQEKKLALLKEKLDHFVAEYKKRIKTPAKKHLVERTWLNEGNTHFTGYTSSKLDENGDGLFVIADCHKAIHWWVYVWLDDKGKIVKDTSRDKLIKQLEDLSKGLGKALKAIDQLRKFFDRELDD